MDPLIILVISLLGAAGFAALLVAAYFMMREEGRRKAGQQPARQAAERVAPAAAEPADVTPPANAPAVASVAPAQPAPPVPHPRPEPVIEVLRVLRDRLSGRLLIEMDGKRYLRPEDVQTDAIRLGLLATLQDLAKFAAPLAPNPQPGPSQAQSPEYVIDEDALAAAIAAQPAPLQPPTMNPFKQLQTLREMAKNAPPPQERSIAEQIDEVLQRKLQSTAYAQRGLRVANSPRGTAVFQADGRVYDSVDDVPDSGAQSLIRAAVAEWEKTQ
jgi:hypothetical protein